MNAQAIQDTISAHPSRVRFLLKAYGVRAEPTLENVLKTYSVAGLPFLVDFARIIEKPNDFGMLSAVKKINKLKAEKQQSGSTPLKEKRKFALRLDSLKALFDKGQSYLKSAQNVSDLVKAKKSGETDRLIAEREAKLAKEERNAKIYLITAGALVVILFIIWFINRK